MARITKGDQIIRMVTAEFVLRDDMVNMLFDPSPDIWFLFMAGVQR